MPLIKNTETGNNFLEKVNTGGDSHGRTAIRSYNKQVGSDGVTNTVFTLPWYYIPDSHTIWVYVNGTKAEYMDTGGDTTQQKLHYDETSNKEITFYFGLLNDDVVEFIVVGNYEGDATGALIPDLTNYKTIDNTNSFISNQSMSGLYKFTQLSVGDSNGDSVRYEQLGDQVTPAGIHYHSYLFDDGMVNPVVSTFTGNMSVNNNKIIDLATCTLNTDATNKIYVDGVETLPTTITGANCTVTDQMVREYTDSLSIYTGIVTVASSIIGASFDFPFPCIALHDIQLTQWFDGVTPPVASDSFVNLSLTGNTGTASIVASVDNTSFYFASHVKI